MHHLKEWERLRADSAGLTVDRHGPTEGRKRKKTAFDVGDDGGIAVFSSDSDSDAGTHIQSKTAKKQTNNMTVDNALRQKRSPEKVSRSRRSKSSTRKVLFAEQKEERWSCLEIAEGLARESGRGNPWVEDCMDLSVMPEKRMEERVRSDGDGTVREVDGGAASQVDEIDLFHSSDEEIGVVQYPPVGSHGSCWLDHVKKETLSPVECLAHASPVDSAKKRRMKFIKNGLAEQLQKVSARERADIAFWKLKKSKEKEEEGSVELQVVSHYMEASLLVARCSVLSDGQYKDCEFVDVVFNSDTHSHLHLAEGSVVVIQPPWQEMLIQSLPHPLLLCTYYCHSRSRRELSLNVSPRKKVLLSPVKLDQEVDSPRRSLTLTPRKTVKRAILFDDADNNQTSPSAVVEEPHSSLHTEGSLVTVKALTHHPSSQQHTSIVEAIESQGGVLASHLDVMGRVQRVYRRRVAARGRLPQSRSCARSFRSHLDKERTWEQCRCLLAQDSSGTCFEILLSNSPNEDQTTWNECIESGESSLYLFSGLHIIKRTNAVRSPGLFSLIKSIAGRSMSLCRKSSDEQVHAAAEGVRETQIQTYCYVFSTTAGRMSRAERCDENGMVSDRFPLYVLSSALESFQLHSGLVCSRCCVGLPVRTQPVLFLGVHVHVVSVCLSVQLSVCLIVFLFVCLFVCQSVVCLSVCLSVCMFVCLPLVTVDVSHMKVNQRCNLVGGILYYHTSDTNSSPAIPDRHLFMTSCQMGSTDCQIVHISMTADCAVTDTQTQLLSDSSIICLRDLVIRRRESEVGLVADGFSVIQRVTVASDGELPSSSTCVIEDGWRDDLEALAPHLPKLSFDVLPNSLVCISGCISNIDEETAYCWPMCNICSNESLEENNPSGEVEELYCRFCEGHVSCPRIGMELTVSVEGGDIPDNMIVTVQLLQSTIEDLLPDTSTQNADEGYDLQSVLGRPLPSLTCFVASVTSQPTGCKHFILKQVSLHH